MTKDVYVLQYLCCKGRCMFYCTASYVACGHFCSIAACAVPGRVCPTAACIAPGRICSSSPKPLLHLCEYVSVYKELLCCIWTCICTRSVPHLIVSSCAAPGCVCLKSLCCTWTCLSIRACAAPGRVCLCLFRNNNICFGCFDRGSKDQKQTEFFVFVS
jgi:hypothetical protein